jgi:hypothetical protein
LWRPGPTALGALWAKLTSRPNSPSLYCVRLGYTNVWGSSVSYVPLPCTGLRAITALRDSLATAWSTSTELGIPSLPNVRKSRVGYHMTCASRWESVAGNRVLAVGIKASDRGYRHERRGVLARVSSVSHLLAELALCRWSVVGVVCSLAGGELWNHRSEFFPATGEENASRGGIAAELKSTSGMSWILFAEHPGSCSFARLGN